MSTIDKLIDLLKFDSNWSTPTWTPIWTTREFMKISTKPEMSIVPAGGDYKEPMLKIEILDGTGVARSKVMMNLAALDEEIGKLISMRDLLAKLADKEQQ